MMVLLIPVHLLHRRLGLRSRAEDCRRISLLCPISTPRNQPLPGARIATWVPSHLQHRTAHHHGKRAINTVTEETWYYSETLVGKSKPYMTKKRFSNCSRAFTILQFHIFPALLLETNFLFSEATTQPSLPTSPHPREKSQGTSRPTRSRQMQSWSGRL